MLLNHFINKTDNMSFVIKTVWEEFKQNKQQYNNILREDDIYPVDKMDINPFYHITSLCVTSLLCQSSNPTTHQVGEYLIQAYKYYNT